MRSGGEEGVNDFYRLALQSAWYETGAIESSTYFFTQRRALQPGSAGLFEGNYGTLLRRCQSGGSHPCLLGLDLLFRGMSRELLAQRSLCLPSPTSLLNPLSRH